MSKKLVAYFSASGVTAKAAKNWQTPSAPTCMKLTPSRLTHKKT